mmetsp:Transcript_17120/g.32209  ORF Transcript_17120/g.32209 Transcript_17120/m.32209 type:complete len:90 (+) Transcript_17120:71-340(+)
MASGMTDASGGRAKSIPTPLRSGDSHRQVAANTTMSAEAKEARKLRKALREIAALEDQHAHGRKLAGPQLEKANRKAEYEERLANIDSW